MRSTDLASGLRNSRIQFVAFVLLSVLTGAVQAFAVNIYEFEVARTYVGALPPPSGPEFPGAPVNVTVTDSFADGVPPPSAPLAFPPLPPGPTTGPLYNLTGTFPAGSESAGALALNTNFGQVLSNPILGGPVSLQRARYQGFGLPVANNYGNYDWRVRGIFDLSKQSAAGGYGIAVTNFATGANNAVLGLRPGGADGNPELRLYYTNFGSNTETEYGDEDLNFAMAQIELELRQSAGFVTGWWRYVGEGAFRQTDGRIPLLAPGPGIVFNFAEFRAFLPLPVPEPGALALLCAGLACLLLSRRRRRQ